MCIAATSLAHLKRGAVSEDSHFAAGSASMALFER